MKVIVAGSRSIKNYDLVEKAIKDSGFYITEILSGCAGGVDEIGEQYAARHGIPVIHFEPNWGTYGKGAGMIRNEEMAKVADALIAVWNGKSVGTKNMIERAKKKGIQVKVVVVETPAGRIRKNEK